MTQTAFDTLDFANKLKAAGLNSKIAETQAELQAIYSTKTGFQGKAQIDSSSLDLRYAPASRPSGRAQETSAGKIVPDNFMPRGAREESKRSVFGIHEHCKRTCNKAENQNAKSILQNNVNERLNTQQTTLNELTKHELATKDDINRLETKIDLVENKLEAKITMIENKLLVKLGGTMVGCSAALGALATFFHVVH